MGGPQTKIRVFLLDDHQLVRAGVRTVLEGDAEIDVVGEAATAAEGLEQILATRPHVALLDVRLPDGNGVEVCRQVRSENPAVACLMLTSFTDDQALLNTILAGASGYLLKDIRSFDLVGAVHKVAAGHRLLEPELTARVLSRLRAHHAEERAVKLTPQEHIILDLIAEGRTNRQIAEATYLAEKTVKNYVSNLLSKLGLSRRTEAAVWALRHDRSRADGEPGAGPGR